MAPKKVVPWDSDWRAVARPAAAPNPPAGELRWPPAASEPATRKRDKTVLFALAGPQQGAVFTVQPPSALIGAGAGTVDVHIDDDTVSGLHARLTLGNHGPSIEDLGSRNGTFVNERRVESHASLTDGDHLRFGESSVIKFSMMDDLEEHALSTLFALTLSDPLTRLYNRRYFSARLHSEFSFARRNGTELALLLIDVDHFKVVNDEHGHPIGDAVLKLTAASIERMMRPEDVLARYGGDEFIVLARAMSLRNAQILGERICRRIEDLTLKLPSLEVRVTVSAGVASLGPDAAVASPETLVAVADKALYRAKAAGRKRVVACAVESEGAQLADPLCRSTRPPQG